MEDDDVAAGCALEVHVQRAAAVRSLQLRQMLVLLAQMHEGEGALARLA